MKKFLPYILILTVILQIFAPFTVGISRKNNLEIKENKVEAIEFDETEQGFKKAFIESENGPTESDLVLTNQITTENSVSIYFKATLDTGYSLEEDSANIYRHIDGFSQGNIENNALILVVKEENKITGIIDVTNSFIQDYESLPSKITIHGININTNTNPNILAPEKEYSVTFYYQATSSGKGWGESIPNLSNDKDYYPIVATNIQVGPAGTTTGSAQDITKKNINDSDSEALPACSLNPFGGEGTVMGCVAQALYYIFFKTTSFVFALAGKILDFTLMYSIQDSSYRSAFVVEGWGLIRDFCNMFFIFILLYIAFGTILNIHSVKPKEMIINVVIIGLLINFSLFATQVIVDASNILARVFYNSKTIVTGIENNGVISGQVGDFGELQLTSAIVSKIDPQKLIMQSSKISALPQKSGVDESTAEEGNITIGTFILVVFLATAVNVVGTIAFLSSALIFIGRVVMLWLAMILAPLAFFSYLVPKLKGSKMIGWENWWPDTLKMAFVAPVFVFFMYLIVGFMGKGLDIINTSMKDASTLTGGLSFVIAIVVPFMFLMILLMKAKSIAVDMSGEMGAAMAKAGAAVGGVGLAVATGGAAMAMRGTVGRLGNKMATSSFAKDTWFGRNVTGKAGKYLGSKSYDVRATKLGGMAAKELGVEGSIGKAKEGGYAKHLSDKVERRQKRAKELEVSENEPLKQQLNREERALQELSARNSHPIEQLDKQIKGANDASAAAAAVLRATNRDDPQFEERQAAAQEAAQRVINLRTQRSNIKNGVGMAPDEHGNMVDQTHNTDNGLISTTAVDQAVADANRTQREATIAENAAVTATRNMATAVADAIAAETAALNAATAAANTAIANATPENLAASAAARTAATAATANLATVRAASAAEVARANAASAAARTAADTAGQTAANYTAEAHRTGTGRSMNDLEDHVIPDAHHAIDRVNRERKNSYARRKARWGGRANREAEHKIIMDTKIDTKEKH